MIKHLVTNGCSWTSGNELEFDPEFDRLLQRLKLVKVDSTNPLNWNLNDLDGNWATTFDVLYNHLNWSGYLKDKIGAEQLTNLSTGGGSNARILRTTLDYVLKLPQELRKETLVVIGWTVSERDEMYIANSWQRWNATQPFNITADRIKMPDDSLVDKITRIQEDYIVYLYNDYAAAGKYFQQSYLLANLLENLGIKYFFFNALPAWWESGELEFKVDVVKEFKEQVQWQETHSNCLSNSNTMYKFVNDHKYPIAPCFHPLSQGHLAWANYLIEVMLERNII
jgi:hypothetical protein